MTLTEFLTARLAEHPGEKYLTSDPDDGQVRVVRHGVRYRLAAVYGDHPDFDPTWDDRTRA